MCKSAVLTYLKKIVVQIDLDHAGLIDTSNKLTYHFDSKEIDFIMVKDESRAPFEICSDRIMRIIQGLFEDFDSLVCALHTDRFDKRNFVFGVVLADSSVVTIEYELWRIIRVREWEQSSRDRPLKGDELELLLYSLAERGSYSDTRLGRSWRFLEREDVTATYRSGKWAVYVEDTERFREQAKLPRSRPG